MSTYSDFREQKRADKALDREQDRADNVARHQARLHEARVREELRQKAAAAAAEQARVDKELAQAARKAQWEAFKGWVRRDSLMTPVIATSVVLSWSGMALFGTWVYGFVGFLLPLFSEGLFVAFAARIAVARREGAPVGSLLVGLTFSGICTAGMQAIHGLAGSHGSWHRAAVMAIVSVAGVIAHQIIIAGPRAKQTPFERMSAEIAREAMRREHKMRLAAVRQAVAEIDETGEVRLVFRPGHVTLSRSRSWRQPQLVEAMPVLPAPRSSVTAVTEQSAAVADVAFDAEFDALVRGTTPFAADLHEPSLAVTGVTGPGQAADTPDTGGGVAVSERPAGNDLAGWIREAQRHIAEGALSVKDTQRTFQKVLGCQTAMAGQVQRALRKHAASNKRGWLRRKPDTAD